MNCEKTIQDAVSGVLEMRDFIAMLDAQPELQDAVRALIPLEARGSTSHRIWNGERQQHLSFHDFEDVDFDMVRALKKGYVTSFGNLLGGDLNAYWRLYMAYRFSHPEAIITDQYHKRFDLYLNVAGEYLDGPEVRGLIASVVTNAMSEPTLGKQRAKAKQQLKELFHLDGRHYPHWVQGPAWPMGKNTPMEFVSRKRKGELVTFLFRDVDTGESKVVEQYF